ncbi:MAG TPA: tryptophan synthase subunit alpha [Thermoanaerobaculia bacterium]|nr:tryptophan synthase subunit alpha [Thermoanaerobaculia bacterium]
MSEISDRFEICRRHERRAAFIPFLMAGDPDLETTGVLLEALVAGGADLIEVGMPFSDPIADGPVIQRAASRALARGVTLSAVLDLIARKRASLGVPMVLFSYFNPIHARGLARFAEQAAGSGVDGVLCVDLPPEEGAVELGPLLARHGVDLVQLLAPTSGDDRVRRVARQASGFVYYVSVTGTTGERQRLSAQVLKDVRRLRKRLPVPLAVGFGISTPEQVAEVASVADGVVVGSALVRFLEERAGQRRLAAALEERVRELSSPLWETRR